MSMETVNEYLGNDINVDDNYRVHTKRSAIEEVQMFAKTIDLERDIWAGIINGELVVIDSEERGIGKTVSCKNIAQKLGVYVLVSSSSKSKVLNSSYKTNVFVSPEEISDFPSGTEVILDEDGDPVKLNKDIKIIGGVRVIKNSSRIKISEIR